MNGSPIEKTDKISGTNLAANTGYFFLNKAPSLQYLEISNCKKLALSLFTYCQSASQQTTFILKPQISVSIYIVLNINMKSKDNIYLRKVYNIY